MKLLVLGAGAWGTAVAVHAAVQCGRTLALGLRRARHEQHQRRHREPLLRTPHPRQLTANDCPRPHPPPRLAVRWEDSWLAGLVTRG